MMTVQKREIKHNLTGPSIPNEIRVLQRVEIFHHIFLPHFIGNH